MRYGSVCSGIEAASVAWEPLGWEPAWFSEIEPFPCKVLAERFPGVPNLGDMTALEERILSGEIEAPDVLVGGTPCQAFSVAGLRGSLSDARGQLSLVFVRLANAIDIMREKAEKPPCIVLWENVPGALSTKDNSFGHLLGGLVGADGPVDPGKRWTHAGVAAGPQRTAAWRILDAQYFGVAQRRRRVFVLARGGAGAWACADALLPLGPRGEWDSEPRRTTRKEAAGGAAAGAALCGITGTLGANGKAAGSATEQDARAGLLVPELANTPKAAGFDASEDGTGRQPALVPEPFAFDEAQVTSPENRSQPTQGAPCHTLARDSAARTCVASEGELRWTVRRLMPTETERLQGFPDCWTAIDGAADGPRYRAIGNSMATTVMRWIGKRISIVASHIEDLL